MPLAWGAAPTPKPGATASNTADTKKLKSAQKQVKSGEKRLDYGQANGTEQSQTLLAWGTPAQDYGQQQHASKANPLERIGNTILAQLNRPSQAVLHGIQERNNGVSGIARGVLQGAAGSDTGAAWSPNNDINLRQAIIAPQLLGAQGWRDATDEQKAHAQDFSKDLGGWEGKVLDFAGTVALDPTNFVGGGAAGARTGLKILKEAGHGDIAAQITAKGAKSLSPEQLALAKQAVHASDQAGKIADNKGGRQALVDKMFGKDARLVGTEGGALLQPAGVKYFGKTILPNSALKAGAQAAKLDVAAQALKDTKAAQALDATVRQPFVKRAAIVSGLGKDAAEWLGRRTTAAETKAGVALDDVVRQFNALGPKLGKEGVDQETFNRTVLTSALESGKHVELANELRTAGKENAAQYVEAAHALREGLTDQQLESGALKTGRDTNTFIPRVATPEATKFLDENPDIAVNLGAKNPSAALLKDVGSQLRNFMPDDKLIDVNAALKDRTGIENFFEPDAVKALTRHAAKVYEDGARLDVFNDLTKYDAGTGTNLAVRVVDNAKQLKEVNAQAGKTVKAIDKQIKSLKVKQNRYNVSAATHRLQSGLTYSAGIKNARNLAKLEALQTKLAHALTSAEDLATAAKDAGTATKNTAALSSKEVRDELKALLDDPTLPAHVRSAFKADFDEAMKAAKWEEALTKAANSSEKARAGAKSVQQNIGRKTTTVKFQRQLLKNVTKQANALRTESERLEKKKLQLALSKPQDVRLGIKTLQAQRKGVFAAAKVAKAQLKAAATERPEGYVRAAVGNVGDFYVDPSVAKYFQDIEHAAKSKGGWEHLGNIFNGANEAWRNLTLNGVGFAQARILRDGFDNSIQMWQKGFSDVTAFKPAAQIVHAIELGTRGGVSRADAIAKANLGPEAKKLYEAMDKEGVLDAGRVRSDIRKQGVAVTGKERLANRLDPRNAESLFTREGSYFSDANDMLSRAAMFIDQYRKYGDAADAARVTDEALFNYKDLAKGEQQLKKVIPFYTYMARNTSLQKWALLHVPQKSLYLDRLKQELANEDSTGKDVLPNYALQAGQVPFGRVGGEAVLGNVQTPFEAAAQTVQPLVDLLSSAGPEKYNTQAGWQGGFAGLAQNVGGVGGNTAKFGAQEAAGANLFTGAPLDKGKYAGVRRLLEAEAPRATSYEGLNKNLGKDATSADRAAQLLKLLGVSSTVVSDKKQTSEVYRRKAAIEDSAARQGIPAVSKLKKKPKSKKK